MATNDWARPAVIEANVPYLFQVRNMFFRGFWYWPVSGDIGLVWNDTWPVLFWANHKVYSRAEHAVIYYRNFPVLAQSA